MTTTIRIIAAIALIAVLSFDLFSQEERPIPRLKQQGRATQLVVDGAPFLIIGGELGNSSASNLAAMASIWPRLDSIGLNTVLVPVYWELIEPKEGKFDFTILDGILSQARTHNLRLVLLWFGSWKNSMSCYAPSWVKSDIQRFPRAVNSDGEGMEILSAFSHENLRADAHAFTALMRHLRAVDSALRTVLMIQVENEIGMIPEARDHCTASNEKFAGRVPAEFTAYLEKNKYMLTPEFSSVWEKHGYKTTGTWSEVFGIGPVSSEIFTAWHYAKYVDSIASAGKAVYSLPMYVNAALIRPGYTPGRYPSGGPLPHLLDVWRAGAPSINFLSPDIYFANFDYWTEQYHHSGNPLFIPEMALDADASANAFFAFGEHDAMGVSPFSIEDLPDPSHARYTTVCRMLRQLAPTLIKMQGSGQMHGVLLDEEHKQTTVEIGNYIFHASHDFTFAYAKHAEGPWPRAGAIIMSVPGNPDEFYVAGTGVIVTFESKTPDDSLAGITSIEEGKFSGGKWTPGRRLNGDQTHQGRHLRIPYDEIGVQKVRLYRYH